MSDRCMMTLPEVIISLHSSRGRDIKAHAQPSIKQIPFPRFVCSSSRKLHSFHLHTHLAHKLTFITLLHNGPRTRRRRIRPRWPWRRLRWLRRRPSSPPRPQRRCLWLLSSARLWTDHRRCAPSCLRIWRAAPARIWPGLWVWLWLRSSCCSGLFVLPGLLLLLHLSMTPIMTIIPPAISTLERIIALGIFAYRAAFLGISISDQAPTHACLSFLTRRSVSAMQLDIAH
ncbi:uncharacterized protein V1518DRAFT_417598 [Limtongia smithiae]|uniref:uncharacterized protein n=1 Tax=Limtongia smithiae TaxID=1125753 RepID=UPI0034CF4F75